MKNKLNFKQTILIASLFFGMLFGAGNMIFPVHLGQLSGYNFWKATIGFIITAVGFPFLGIISISISKKKNLLELGSFIGEKYKYVFTTILYLTIGPFFAIPRCATVSYTMGLSNIINTNNRIYLLIFTFIFFLIVLLFALKPNKIVTWIGQYLNPVFLIFLLILIFAVLLNTINQPNNFIPQGDYYTKPFFTGFLEGYNTMDTIASLAFGISIIEAINNFNVVNKEDVTHSIITSCFITCILMAIIYILISQIGLKSLFHFEISDNGGIALSQISNLYFGKLGNYLLLIIITLACLKTALGLIVSCAEMFNYMFKNFLSLKQWTIIFVVVSFAISNFGLNTIIEFSIPILMLIYPLTISIIFLSLFGKFFNYRKEVFISATIFTLLFSILDLIKTLPKSISNIINTSLIIDFCNKYIPLYDLGLGWILPFIFGVVIGLILIKTKKQISSQ